MDTHRDVSRDTVMLTYDELAARLGIDVQSARRRALRHRWPKTRGNDGKARVAVPTTVLPAAGATVAATDATPADGVGTTVEALSRLLSQVGELGELRERLGRAEGESATLREQVEAERQWRERAEARAGQVEAERDTARAELAEWTAGGPLARAWRAFMNRRGRA